MHSIHPNCSPLFMVLLLPIRNLFIRRLQLKRKLFMKCSQPTLGAIPTPHPASTIYTIAFASVPQPRYGSVSGGPPCCGPPSFSALPLILSPHPTRVRSSNPFSAGSFLPSQPKLLTPSTSLFANQPTLSSTSSSFCFFIEAFAETAVGGTGPGQRAHGSSSPLTPA